MANSNLRLNIYFSLKFMSKYQQGLSSLLEVRHRGDMSGSSNENLSLYVFSLLYDLLYNFDVVKRNKYYVKCDGFRTLCDDFKENMPKAIFERDSDGSYMLNSQHPKVVLFRVYFHSFKYALNKLKF